MLHSVYAEEQPFPDSEADTHFVLLTGRLARSLLCAGYMWAPLLSRGASRDVLYLLSSILVFFPVAVTKYHDKSNLGREGSFFLTVHAIVHPCREIKVVEA